MATPTEIEGRSNRADGAVGAATCYGYEIETSLSLRYLRPGVGATSLRISEIEGVDEPVDEPMRRWIPTRDHPFEATLHDDGGRFKFWVKGTGWYLIDPHVPEIKVPRGADPVWREERAWGFPAALCFIARGDLPIHAAAVDVGGRALLFAAPGRFGKTTLAAAFLRRGYRLLSEDISCCRLGDPAVVIPGPAMLRVRHDAYEHLDLASTTVVASDDDRVHLALEDGVRGDGEPVPLAGILLLRKGDGPTTVERVTPTDALQDLWALSFKLPTDDDRARSFAGVTQVADRVPIWNLQRRLRYDELDRVIDLVIDTCSVRR